MDQLKKDFSTETLGHRHNCKKHESNNQTKSKMTEASVETLPQN